MLLRLACTRLGSTADAEDAVQEAFLMEVDDGPVHLRQGPDGGAKLFTGTLRGHGLRHVLQGDIPLFRLAACSLIIQHALRFVIAFFRFCEIPQSLCAAGLL